MDHSYIHATDQGEVELDAAEVDNAETLDYTDHPQNLEQVVEEYSHGEHIDFSKHFQIQGGELYDGKQCGE